MTTHGDEDPDDYHTSIKENKILQTEKRSAAFKEKNRIVITSILASAGLALAKFVIGFSTNSLGILSEAMHSGLDVLAALMTFYAIRLVIRSPDSKYTYGYAKIESLTSLAAIFILFLIASWIFYEGIERIFFTIVEPEITVFSFAIMITSIVVDYGRSKALFQVARKYGSQAIEADALHFRADMLSSSVVLVGLFLVFFLHIPNADAYAALIIGVMIIYTSLGLGKRTLDVLLDRAPQGISLVILESISGLNGVNRAHDLRVRNVGSTFFIDLHIEVPRTSTHDKAHKIATNVENKIRQVIPNSDVLVHVDAIESESETMVDRIRLIAAETNGIKNIHSIFLSKLQIPEKKSTIYDHHSSVKENKDNNENNSKTSSAKNLSNRTLHLYLDVQVDSNLDLHSAHDIIESFEGKVKEEIPEIRNITSHIEIEGSADTKTIGIERKATKTYIEKIRDACLKVDRVVDCKDIGIVDMNGAQHITLTILIKSTDSSDISINEAHQIATTAQEMIIKATGATRAVVHTEPSL